jgi:mycothiol synthase
MTMVIGGTEVTFRTGTADDWDAIAGIVNAARRADDLAEVRTGESLADEYRDTDFLVFARDSLLAEVDGRVVGWALGFLIVRDGVLTGETFGDVHPDWRRRGIGGAIFDRLRERLATEAAADPRPGHRELRTYCMEVETGDIALYRDRGYVPIRFGFEMRRYLTGSLPEIPLPDGLLVRPPVEAEYRAVFDADDEAFGDHWGHRTADEADFQARFYGSEMDPSLFLVAWDGDQVAGVVMNSIFADENAELGVRRGWLEHVSVRRPWRGRGVAKALCAASFRLLRDHDLDEAWLGVDASNPTGALQLYEGLGFAVVRRWYAFGRPMDRPAPVGWQSGQP